jgi:serine/threonine-protein kinase
MEYIDGEDLASLLQRIGYLSNEKALDIARQLVAGLAAAHERGVLHRDLKPANVMLDGRGRVRIADFGLAVAVADEAESSEMSGTPAYMAPEQLAGKGATVRSDLYALGLVLYELYTGTRAFTAPTLAELRQQKETRTPPAPSELRSGVDPVVERVIARCLEHDPQQRPTSAMQVAASLPGGDPLAAAIAAGETPSPEMVAASGVEGQLRPIVGVSLLLLAAVASVLLVVLNGRSSLPRRVPFDLPPAVLANDAREILEALGYSTPAADSAFGLNYDREYIDDVGQMSTGPGRFDRLGADAIYLWYRQSPRPLEHKEFALIARVDPEDPPLQYSGDALVFVNSEGRLRRLEVLAPQVIADDRPARDVDWGGLFAAAGLDIGQWRTTEPRWNPLHHSDTRASWEGTLPPSGMPVRIDAAAYRGAPVWFDIVLPSATASREPESGRSALATRQRGSRSGVLGVLLVVLFTIGVVFFARRNLRMGRGDRRGAMRLVWVNATCGTAAWVVEEHHVGTTGELSYALQTASVLLFTSALCWLGYMALEPFVRRQWPQMLVSWARLLAGGLRDPLVGRDILIGCTAGILFSCLGQMEYFSLLLFGHAEPFLNTPSIGGLAGPLAFLAQAIGATFFVGGVILPGFWLFFLCVLRMIVRNTWVAAAAVALVLVPVVSSRLLITPSPEKWLILPVALVGNTLLLSVLIRFGFLPLAVAGYVLIFLTAFPLTFDASIWYAGFGYAALAFVAALALFGFRTAVGGRRMFETADV